MSEEEREGEREGRREGERDEGKVKDEGKVGGRQNVAGISALMQAHPIPFHTFCKEYFSCRSSYKPYALP